MDKPKYLGFAVLQLSKLLMYLTQYDKLQPYFGQEKLQLHYIDADSFVLSMYTKDIIKDFENLGDFFYFISLDENHDIFG